MSYYSAGLAVQSRKPSAPTAYHRGLYGDQVGGFAFWRGLKTPGMIREEVNRINAEVTATGSDLFQELNRKGAFPPDLKDRPASVLPLARFFEIAWSPFVQTWGAFVANHQGWTSNIWGDTWDETQTFQAQLDALRQQAKKVGFDLSSTPEIVKQPDTNIFSGLVWTILKISLIGGAILLAFMYLSKRIG